MSGDDLRLEVTLTAEQVEAIAVRAAELVDVRKQTAHRTRWMRVAEAADYARCSRQHIYDLRSDGRLGRYGEHGHALVNRHELDAYLGNSR